MQTVCEYFFNIILFTEWSMMMPNKFWPILKRNHMYAFINQIQSRKVYFDNES